MRVPLLRIADVDRAENWFARLGDMAVLLGRMVPLLCGVISLPAGTTRTGVFRFVGLTTVGSVTWNTVFVTAGYRLGESWYLVERYAGAAQYVVIAAVPVATALFMVRHLRGARPDQSSSRPACPHESRSRAGPSTRPSFHCPTTHWPA